VLLDQCGFGRNTCNNEVNNVMMLATNTTMQIVLVLQLGSGGSNQSVRFT
jgi:hypothetical protein